MYRRPPRTLPDATSSEPTTDTSWPPGQARTPAFPTGREGETPAWHEAQKALWHSTTRPSHAFSLADSLEELPSIPNRPGTREGRNPCRALEAVSADAMHTQVFSTHRLLPFWKCLPKGSGSEMTAVVTAPGKALSSTSFPSFLFLEPKCLPSALNGNSAAEHRAFKIDPACLILKAMRTEQFNRNSLTF